MGIFSFFRKRRGGGLPADDSMRYLIVGLGNMGDEYSGTRHNVGFMVADELARAAGCSFEDRRYGMVCRLRVKNAELVVLKPSTFMNLSGNAVRYWMQKEHVEVDKLMIVADDLSLPLGTLRMKPGGSAAGHNGLRHIAQILGTEQYGRLRIGIGNDFPRGGQIDFVLGRFGAEERKVIEDKLPAACEALKAFALSGIQFAMNHYNGK